MNIIKNKKNKILNKITIIDIFIIIMFFSIVFSTFFKIEGKNKITRKMEYVTMKFYTESLEDFIVDKLKIEDIVSDDTNIYLGKINNIKKEESINFEYNKDGILTKSSKKGYSSLEITTKLKAYKYDKTIIISGNIYYIGKNIIIRAGDTKIFLQISDISFKK